MAGVLKWTITRRHRVLLNDMQQAPHIAIRQAQGDDVNHVAAVFDAAFAPLRRIYRPTREVAARQAERANEGIRLVATIDGQVVGTVQFDSHKEHVHVIGLAVHPEFQRMGIARRMINWIVAKTPSLGHSLVVLDTIKETGNVPLFEKLGFSVFREDVTNCFVSEEYPVLHEVKMKRNVAYQDDAPETSAQSGLKVKSTPRSP